MTKCPAERNYLIPDDLDGLDIVVIMKSAGESVPVITADRMQQVRESQEISKGLKAAFYESQAILAGLMYG